MTRKELHELMLKKLAESGLDAADAKRMRLTILTAAEVSARRGAFDIPYFTPEGKLSKFSRLRYLEKASGFAAQTERGEQRYWQELGSLNEIYLPPFLDWPLILKDPKQDLIITEGELKAACAAKNGLPCIGLGGVWMFKASKKGKAFLDGLVEIVWNDRNVYIVYDSDAVTNPKVTKAENALASELLARGAHVYIGRIPALKGEGK